MRITQRHLDTLFKARQLARYEVEETGARSSGEVYGDSVLRKQWVYQHNQAKQLSKELQDLLDEALGEWEVGLPLFDEEGTC